MSAPAASQSETGPVSQVKSAKSVLAVRALSFLAAAGAITATFLMFTSRARLGIAFLFAALALALVTAVLIYRLKPTTSDAGGFNLVDFVTGFFMPD